MDVVRKKRTVSYSIAGYGPMSRYMLLRQGPADATAIPSPGANTNSLNEQINFILDRRNLAVIEFQTPAPRDYGVLLQAKRIIVLEHACRNGGQYQRFPVAVEMPAGTHIGTSYSYNDVCDWLFSSHPIHITGANPSIILDYGTATQFDGYTVESNAAAVVSQQVDDQWEAISPSTPTYTSRLKCQVSGNLRKFFGTTHEVPEFDGIDIEGHALWLGANSAGRVPALVSSVSTQGNHADIAMRTITQELTANIRGSTQQSSDVLILPYLHDGQRL